MPAKPKIYPHLSVLCAALLAVAADAGPTAIHATATGRAVELHFSMAANKNASGSEEMPSLPSHMSQSGVSDQPLTIGTVFLPMVNAGHLPYAAAGHVGGWVIDAATDGHVAVLALERRIVTLDLARGDTTLSQLGQSDVLPEALIAVALDGRHAWAVSLSGVVYGFDVSDPANPRIASTLWLSSDEGEPVTARSVSAAGDRLYVGAVQSIFLLDIHLPESPQVVSSFDLASLHGSQGQALDLVAKAGILYAVQYFSDDDPGSLLAIDWSDQASPVLAATHELGLNPLYRIALAGDWLIAARGYVEFYDVAEPTAIRQVASTRLPPPPGPAWDDVLPDIVGQVWAIATDGNRAWLLGHDEPSRLVELQMEPEWPPTVRTTLPGIAGEVIAAASDSAVVYKRLPLASVTVLATTNQGIDIVDSIPWAGETSRLRISGERIYTSSSVIDNRNPRDPKVAAYAPRDWVYADERWMITVSPRDVVAHWDVLDPSYPKLAAEYSVPGIEAWEATLVGASVYLAGSGLCGDETCPGVYTLRPDGSEHPHFEPIPIPRLGAYKIGDADAHLVVGGGDGFAVLNTTGLEVTLVGNARFAEIKTALALGVVEAGDGTGPYLVAVDWRTAEIYDLSDPLAPRLLHLQRFPSGSGYPVDVVDNRLFLKNWMKLESLSYLWIRSNSFKWQRWIGPQTSLMAMAIFWSPPPPSQECESIRRQSSKNP